MGRQRVVMVVAGAAAVWCAAPLAVAAAVWCAAPLAVAVAPAAWTVARAGTWGTAIEVPGLGR